MSEFVHELLTPWNYAVDAETIPNFITEKDFNLYTNCKFSDDTRIIANIPSACASIRDYCGWHVSPNLACGVIYRVNDLRDYLIGNDLVIQLPAKHVTSIEKVVLDAVLNDVSHEYEGELTTDYDIDMGSGLLRVYDVGKRDRRSKIFVKFNAGYPDADISTIKELAADLVSHSVVNPYGVNSETAGGVSVSYSSSWAGRANSTTLVSDARDMLETYKVRRVF